MRNVEFKEKVGLLNEKEMSAYDLVKNFVQQKIGNFTSKDVIENCPRLGRSSILSSLEKLTAEGFMMKQGIGKSTFYVKADIQ